jgi:hypothetical protein
VPVALSWVVLLYGCSDGWRKPHVKETPVLLWMHRRMKEMLLQSGEKDNQEVGCNLGNLGSSLSSGPRRYWRITNALGSLLRHRVMHSITWAPLIKKPGYCKHWIVVQDIVQGLCISINREARAYSYATVSTEVAVQYEKLLKTWKQKPGVGRYRPGVGSRWRYGGSSRRP